MSDNFTYDYSAAQNVEAERIMRKYTGGAKEYSDIEKLRRLDRKAEGPGQVAAMTVGIIGTLVMGAGMSLVMVMNSLIIGIILGVVGIVVMLAAYPIYKKVTAAQREKVRDEILAISERIKAGQQGE